MNLKRNAGKLCIVFGVVCILFAISSKILTQYKENLLLHQYESYILSEKQKKVQRQKSSLENSNYQETLSSNQSEQEEIIVSDKPGKSAYSVITGKTLGILSIPEIDLKVTIGEGVGNETLKYAVGHFTQTAMPGDPGNCCIIGHRNYTFGEYFNRLDEVEIGDSIIVQRDADTFTYLINEIKVVEPEELSVLDETEDETITLITCTPIRKATHRLIIKGSLKDS